MKKALSTFVWLLLSCSIYGQNRLYLGIESGLTNDFFEFYEKENQFKSLPLINGIWGIHIQKDLNNYFSMGTGMLRNNYTAGISFNGIHNKRTIYKNNSIRSWQIPVRILLKIPLKQHKIRLFSTLGFHFCMNDDYGSYDYGGMSLKTGTESIYITDSSDYTRSRTFPLLETGLGCEFRILKNVLLTLSANYYTGFKKVVFVRYTCQVNNNPVQKAATFSKGEYLCVAAGILYPISHAWTKSK